MPKYNESITSGESWRRAYQILIDNRLGVTPRIRFSEEDVFVSSDGTIARGTIGGGVEEEFTLNNALEQFQLKNPETEEYIEQYARYQDLYVLIHSLYFHLAKLRDQGPRPYPSWTYNETTKAWEPPVPIPDINGSYKWNEALLMWEETNGVDP